MKLVDDVRVKGEVKEVFRGNKKNILTFETLIVLRHVLGTIKRRSSQVFLKAHKGIEHIPETQTHSANTSNTTSTLSNSSQPSSSLRTSRIESIITKSSRGTSLETNTSDEVVRRTFPHHRFDELVVTNSNLTDNVRIGKLQVVLPEDREGREEVKLERLVVMHIKHGLFHRFSHLIDVLFRNSGHRTRVEEGARNRRTLRSNTLHRVTFVRLPIYIAIQLIKDRPSRELFYLVTDEIEGELIKPCCIFSGRITKGSGLTVKYWHTKFFLC